MAGAPAAAAAAAAPVVAPVGAAAGNDDARKLLEAKQVIGATVMANHPNLKTEVDSAADWDMVSEKLLTHLTRAELMTYVEAMNVVINQTQRNRLNKMQMIGLLNQERFKIGV